jgi:subtilisin family serine protease
MRLILLLLLSFSSFVFAQTPAVVQQDLMNFEPGELIVKLKDDVDAGVYYEANGKAMSNFNIGELLGIEEKVASSKVMFHQNSIESSIQNQKRLAAQYAAQAAANPNNGYQPEPPRSMKNVFVITTTNEQENIPMLVEELNNNPNVDYAEPNYIYGIDDFEVGEIITAEQASKMTSSNSSSTTEVNDPLYSSQSNITATNIDDVWDQYTTGDGSQVIAILDTGVDYTHPDLEANIWINEAELNGVEGYDDDGNGYIDDIRGWDFINIDNAPLDDNMHGTHVAGIAGAVGNNGIGIAGAAWDVKLMPIKVFQSTGQGNSVTISEGIEYAYYNGATVINMSFSSANESLTMRLALENAYATAILVAASGNYGIEIGPGLNPPRFPFFPAAYSFVLGIEANAPWSNYDFHPYFTVYPFLYNYEITAPGSSITSTIPGGGYTSLNGTSMAAPLVSGALALYKEIKPDDSKELMFGNLINTGHEPYVDFLAAVQAEPEPKLAIITYSTEDDLSQQNDNGYLEPGETIEILPLIKNYWGPTDDVRVGIEFAEFEDQTKATIIQDEIQIGSISAYSTLQDLNETLKISISQDVANKVQIKFILTAWSGPDQQNMSNPLEITVEITNAIIFEDYITEDFTLTNDKEWIFQNSMVITNGATLTIDPGTIVRMSSQAKIIVCPTCSIFSNGTADEPVKITGVSGPGVSESYVYWGGVVIEDDNDTRGEITLDDLNNDGVEELVAEYGDNSEILSSTDEMPNSIAFQRAKFFFTEFEYVMGVGIGDYMYYGTALYQNCIFSYNATDSYGGIFYGGDGSIFIDKSLITRSGFYGLTALACFDRAFNCGVIYRNTNWIYNTHALPFTFYNPGYEPLHIDFSYLDENYNSPLYHGQIETIVTNNFTSPGNPGTYPSLFLQMYGGTGEETGVYPFPNQFWFGTTSEQVLRTMFYDYSNPRPDNLSVGLIDYSTANYIPYEDNHAVVWKVEVNGYDAQDEYELLDPLGVGTHEFKVYFNREMDTSVDPQVSFGVVQPYNQNILNDGSWSEDGKIYTVNHEINIGAADGINRIRVQDAQDLDYFKIPIEDKRFNFLLQSAGSASTGFFAAGGLGKIDLEWVAPSADELDDVLGYNMYRYQIDEDGNESEPEQLNETLIIEDTDESTTGVYFTDYDVVEGQTYFYKYKILRTSFEETDYSNTVSSAPLTSTLGDSNGDFAVNVLDLVHDVDYILGNNPEPFIFVAGDVNADNTINVLDIVGTVDIILNGDDGDSSSGSLDINFYPSEPIGYADFSWEGNDLYVESMHSIGGLQLAFDADFEYVLHDLPGVERLDYTQDESKVLMLYSFNNTAIASTRTKLLTRLDSTKEIDIDLAVAGTTTGAKLTPRFKGGELDGIDSPFQSNSLEFLKLFPNPSNGDITLEYYLPKNMDGAVAKVYDMVGRLVWVQDIDREEGMQQTDLNLNSLQKGNYVVIISAGNNIGKQLINHKLLILK